MRREEEKGKYQKIVNVEKQKCSQIKGIKILYTTLVDSNNMHNKVNIDYSFN